MSALRNCGLVFIASLCLYAQGQTISQLSRARDVADRDKGISDAEKKQILELYDQAIASARSSIQFKAALLGQQRKLEAAKRELGSLQDEVGLSVSGRSSAVPEGATSQALVEALAQAVADREARQKAVASLNQANADLGRRRDEISQRRAALRRDLENADDQLAVVQLTSMSEPWEQATRAQLAAVKDAAQAEIEALNAERLTLDVLQQQIPLQREIGKQRLEAAQQDIQKLRERQQEAFLRDTQVELERLKKAARESAKASPQLSELADEVEALAGQMYGPDGAVVSLEKVTALKGRMAQQTSRVEQIFSATKRRYQATDVFAPVTDWLQPVPPDVQSLNELQTARSRQVGRLPEVRREIVVLEEQLGHEAALETQIQQLKAQVSAPAAGPEFEARARILLQNRRRLRDELLQTDQQLEARLAEFDRDSQKALDESKQFGQFVWKRILWARSSPMGPPRPIADLGRGLLWFAANPDWRLIGEVLGNRGPFYFVWIPMGLLAVAFWFRGTRLRRFTNPVREDGGAGGEGRPAPTVYSIFWTLLGALLRAAGPAALFYWLHWLFDDDQMPPLGQAISAGFLAAAGILFVVLLIRRAMKQDGLAEVYLHVGTDLREAVFGESAWLRFVLPPLCFLFAGFVQVGILLTADPRLRAYHNSLGRTAFLAALAAVCLAVFRVSRKLRPGTVSERRTFAVVMTILGVLFLLALSGFYVTALFLGRNLLSTVLLTALLLLIPVFLFEWRRELGAPAAPARKAAKPAEAQVKQLIRFLATCTWIVGALVIWSEAFPAISMLRNVELLPRPRIVRQDDRGPEGVRPLGQLLERAQAEPSAPAAATAVTMPGMPATKAPEKGANAPAKTGRASPLTLLDVIDALAIGLLCAYLIRNIPGLLELTVLRRLRLDSGGIYAVNTITRYVITFFAIITVSAILGIRWTHVQWLAAALTFGIGFGLQDIFANFAAGLILLFDRSLRVGDAVSLGELSGRVSEIKMRATTVTLWNRSEMVVPNKEFITTKLVNWTLSIPEARVDLKVGVAYGSDLELVRRVLYEVAEANPDVLRTPPPQVLLVAFADSTINFELQVFCLFDTGRANVLDELHRAVYREFDKQGISIAYPQLDVHIKDSSGPAPAGSESGS